MKGDPFDFEFDPSQLIDEPISTVTTFSLRDEQKVELEINAGAGNAESAFRLYLYFNFSVRDDIKSEEWLLRSAEMDHPTAQYNIAAYFYQHENYKDALYWCGKAKQRDHPKAEALLKRINKKLDLM